MSSSSSLDDSVMFSSMASNSMDDVTLGGLNGPRDGAMVWRGLAREPGVGGHRGRALRLSPRRRGGLRGSLRGIGGGTVGLIANARPRFQASRDFGSSRGESSLRARARTPPTPLLTTSPPRHSQDARRAHPFHPRKAAGRASGNGQMAAKSGWQRRASSRPCRCRSRSRRPSRAAGSPGERGGSGSGRGAPRARAVGRSPLRPGIPSARRPRSPPERSPRAGW